MTNPIVYFEEDNIQCLTNCDWCGRILDIIPHVTDDGLLYKVEFIMENSPQGGGGYFISYQRSFKIRLQDGQEFNFKGRHDVEDDAEFNKKFRQFVEDFHNGKYEKASKLQVVDEVEFMDI